MRPGVGAHFPTLLALDAVIPDCCGRGKPLFEVTTSSSSRSKLEKAHTPARESACSSKRTESSLASHIGLSEVPRRLEASA